MGKLQRKFPNDITYLATLVHLAIRNAFIKDSSLFHEADAGTTGLKWCLRLTMKISKEVGLGIPVGLNFEFG